MRGATCVIVQTHQILRLPRKMTSRISKKFAENGWNVISNARPIRPWSDHDPSMKPSVRNPPRNRGYLSRPPRAFCIEKYNISRSGYHSKFHRILRLPRKVTLALHQILRLPQKVTLALHQILHLPRKVTLELQQTEPLLDWAMTSLNYYLTDDTLTTPITWRHYLTTLLDDTYYLTTLLDDTYYWTTPITWRHYLTTPTTWRHYLTTPITWRHYLTTLLDDTYYLTTLLDDTYYLTTLLDDTYYLTTLLDDT